jgi:hypothetical protein
MMMLSKKYLLGGNKESFYTPKSTSTAGLLMVCLMYEKGIDIGADKRIMLLMVTQK